MKKNTVKIVIGLFILAILVIGSHCVASSTLEFEEGMKYSYSYEMPLSSLSQQTDIFVTESNDNFWEGAVIVSIDMSDDSYDSTRLYRFKISKDTYDFYETDYLRLKTFQSEDVEFNHLTSDGSQTGITSYLVFLLLQNLYDFDMAAFLEDRTASNVTLGGSETDMTLEGPVDFLGYSCYKITATSENEYTTSTATLYISTISPYLLVSWNTKVGDIDNYAYYTLEGVEQETFRYDDYDIDEPSNKKPRAIMNYTINGLTVDFNASLSYDSDGSILSYLWDFGDGTNATGMSVQHTFSDTKRYTVKLYVTDDEGEESIDMEFIDISSVETDNNSRQNQEDPSQTSGFELFLIIFSMILLIIYKKKKE